MSEEKMFRGLSKFSEWSSMFVRRSASLAMALASGITLAQSYPVKPINFVLPVPPGSIDMAGRVYAESVSNSIGQRLVVANVGGSGGVQAMQQVKNAAPDGYTILMGTSAGMAVLKAVRTDLPFDPEKDFRPVTLLYVVPSYVTTHSGNPFRSIGELLSFAKKNPGKLTYGSQGIASPGHFQGAMFVNAVEVDMLHVPYKGGIPMIMDLVAQRVDLGFNTWSATNEFVRAGKLRYLAVTEPARRPEEPNVPTLAELGIRGVEHNTWAGVFAPEKTPDEIVTRLNQEFVRAARASEVVKRLTAEGFLIRSGSPEELRKFQSSEIDYLRNAVRKFGIKPE
ncbi:MAG: Bug family tripartite tricarboxylate transporter substrate binding protein [Burkholderiales bacterium]